MSITGISDSTTTGFLSRTAGTRKGLEDQLQALQDADHDAVQKAFDAITQNAAQNYVNDILLNLPNGTLFKASF